MKTVHLLILRQGANKLSLNNQQVKLLKRVDEGQVSATDVQRNEILNNLIFKRKFVEYTLNSNRRTGRYMIKNLYLTEKGKIELALALQKRLAKDKSNTKVMLLVAGLLIGVFIGKFLFSLEIH